MTERQFGPADSMRLNDLMKDLEDVFGSALEHEADVMVELGALALIAVRVMYKCPPVRDRLLQYFIDTVSEIFADAAELSAERLH